MREKCWVEINLISWVWEELEVWFVIIKSFFNGDLKLFKFLLNR